MTGSTSNVSAIVAPSLSWDAEAVRRTEPKYPRAYICNESMVWQLVSQRGSDAEMDAYPFPFRRVHTRNGVSKTVPNRNRRPPREDNRLVELHGLMGAVGEQLGLAWSSEQDAQRFVATKAQRTPEHQRLVLRALAETAGLFTLGAGHSLGNLVLRLLMLNGTAAQSINAISDYRGAQGFIPGSDDFVAWRTLNSRLVANLTSAAALGGNRFMAEAVVALGRFGNSKEFRDLDLRRGMDYHRRRPQSVPHASPRAGTVSRSGGTTTRRAVAAQVEPEADADNVHAIVVAALRALRVTMRDIRLVMPKAIRGERIAYIVA